MPFVKHMHETTIDLSPLKISPDDEWSQDKEINRSIKYFRDYIKPEYNEPGGTDLEKLLTINEISYSELVMYEPLGSEDEYVLRYSTCESTGSIVGFLGFYVDMASGYAVLGGKKEKSYIPLFNMVRVIEASLEKDHNSISLGLFKEAVEQYKLNEMTIQDLFYSLAIGFNANTVEVGSYFVHYFKELVDDNAGIKDRLEVDVKLTAFLYKMSTVLNTVKRMGRTMEHAANSGREFTTSRTPDYSSQMLYKDDNIKKEFREKVGDSFFEVALATTSYYEKAKYLDIGPAKYPDDIHKFINHPERVHETSLLHSAMAEPDFFRASLGENPLHRVKKSEVIALNFLDLVEETEEPYVEVMDMSVEEDFDGLKELVGRLDLQDVLKGAKLSAIKRGFKEEALKGNVASSLRINDLIKRRDNHAKHFDDSFLGNDVRKYTDLSKFIERIFKRIDSI